MRSPDVVGNHFTNMDITFLPFRGARVSRKTWFVLTTKTVSGGANRGVNRSVGFRKPHLFLNDECESAEAMGIAWLHGTDQEQSGPTQVEIWSTTEAIQRTTSASMQRGPELLGQDRRLHRWFGGYRP